MQNPSSDNVHVINKDKVNVVDGAVNVVGYGLGGKEVDSASKDCLAKKSSDSATGQSRYWVKKSTYGPTKGSMFNPHDPFHDVSGANRFHARLDRGQFEFSKASQESFESYLRFLQSGNPVHLRHAERQ